MRKIKPTIRSAKIQRPPEITAKRLNRRSAPGALLTVPKALAGEAGAEWLYDHHDEIAGQVAETGRWIRDRTAHVAAKAAHGFDRGMPPYSTPLR